MKYLLQRFHGYGGLPRKPLLEIVPDAAQALWDHSHTSDIFELESELTGKKVSKRSITLCDFQPSDLGL